MKNSGETDTVYVFDSEEIQQICPMFDEVTSFFNRKTKGERLPRRSDFTPAELVKYLPNIILLELEYDASGSVEDAFCRVCGSLCAVIYGEVTGTWLSKFEKQEIFLRTRDRWRVMVERRQIFAITTQVLSKDRDHSIVRALYIPLSEDGNTIEKLITLIEYDRPSKAPGILY